MKQKRGNNKCHHHHGHKQCKRDKKQTKIPNVNQDNLSMSMYYVCPFDKCRSKVLSTLLDIYNQQQQHHHHHQSVATSTDTFDPTVVMDNVLKTQNHRQQQHTSHHDKKRKRNVYEQQQGMNKREKKSIPNVKKRKIVNNNHICNSYPSPPPPLSPSLLQKSLKYITIYQERNKLKRIMGLFSTYKHFISHIKKYHCSVTTSTTTAAVTTAEKFKKQCIFSDCRISLLTEKQHIDHLLKIHRYSIILPISQHEHSLIKKQYDKEIFRWSFILHIHLLNENWGKCDKCKKMYSYNNFSYHYHCEHQRQRQQQQQDKNESLDGDIGNDNDITINVNISSSSTSTVDKKILLPSPPPPMIESYSIISSSIPKKRDEIDLKLNELNYHLLCNQQHCNTETLLQILWLTKDVK